VFQQAAGEALTASSLEPGFNQQPTLLLGHEGAILRRSEADAQISLFLVTARL